MVNIRPTQFEHETPTTNADPTTSRQWSPYQSAIFDFVSTGTGSAIVIAVAGSGKTTTIVEAANRLMSDGNVASLAASNRFSAAFVAFNKSIADELKTRLPGSVRARTLNSLGFGAWRHHVGIEAANSIRLDASKTRQLCQDLIPPRDYTVYSKSMPQLIGIAKAVGLVPNILDSDQYDGLVEDTDQWWLDTVDAYGLDFEADFDQSPDAAALLAAYGRKILTKSIELAERLIDFDDQLYMPVITGARFWQNDFMFVDEAQDLNHVQRVMVRRALKPRGRLIAVGDPNQAIYSFRGAASDSMSLIKREFGCVELPLTISYRCPKAVVNEAHQWVSHIQAADTAVDGSVSTWGRYDAQKFQPTDSIVCRNTKPLIEMAFGLLRDQVPCKVRGRDIGAGLVAIIKRFKTDSLAEFQEKFGRYVDRKVAKFLADHKEELAQRLQDQADTIAIFVDELEEGDRVQDLVAKIESLFTDNGPTVLTLSTIHKAKGLEFSRVFILDPDLMPSRYAKTPEAKRQEGNLQYVAVTRAKVDLVYISSKGFKPGSRKPTPPKREQAPLL